MTGPDPHAIYGQAGFACRFEWGLRGVFDAADRGDIIIVVDVLSFSSTTTVAIEFGAEIYPYPLRDGAEAFAARVGAHLRLGDSVPKGRRALSPGLFTPADRGRRYVLCSLNGATCAHAAPRVPALFAGCLRNAAAVARAADRARTQAGADVTVVACGEKWNDPREGENDLRPCIEDYLGAGAILTHLTGARSPEAEVCAVAFSALRSRLEDLIRDCASGRELCAQGYADDVRQCARLNCSEAVPRLDGERFAADTPCAAEPDA